MRTLTTRVTHVLPVSDDGGSTAEIVRVLGGPAVGDIRSRCLRLADDSNEEVKGEHHAGACGPPDHIMAQQRLASVGSHIAALSAQVAWATPSGGELKESANCVQARAVKRLLAHRLDGSDAAAARREWHDLVEGQHALWAGVSDPYKHTIRAFLVHFHSAILRHSSERFNFLNGSIGAAGVLIMSTMSAHL